MWMSKSAKTAGRFGAYAGAARERVVHGGQRALREARLRVAEHPMAVVGTALAAGLVIGLLIGRGMGED